MNAQATNSSATSTTSAGSSGKQGEDPSTTIGVGGLTSGQSGATPSHETQRETGGSGGEQLTGNQDEGGAATGAGTPSPAAGAAPGRAAEPDDSSMQSGARGAFDTRSGQGGGTGTGLGSPESGANQSEADLPPASQGRRDDVR